jgi:integrase/recombinase XerD
MGMTERFRLSTPVDLWPMRDRDAWLAALVPEEFAFDDPPRIAGWAPRTRYNAAMSIGRFVAWARQSGRLTDQPSLCSAVTQENLHRFIADERERIGCGAIANQLFHLIGGLEVFAAKTDWTWVWRLHSRVEARAKHEGTQPRQIVHGRRLYRLGMEMMATAVRPDGSADASGFRDGLAVALLAMAPLRISNFCGLRIGGELRQEHQGWVIHLRPEQTKTRHQDIWVMAGDLAERINFYVDHVRPALLAQRRETTPTGLFWIGNSGCPVGPQTIRKWIKVATEVGLGTCISPHTFRHCAATTLVLEEPETAVEASTLLGHASLRTTERNYIIQQGQLVQRRYLMLLHQRMRAGGHE